MYRLFLKRILDFVLSLFASLLLSPFFLCTLLLLLIANRGKAFFVQKRPGKDGVIFSIYKFKTMNDKTDEEGNLLSDGERLTRIGSIVRKLSLDELPQLLNVLKGQMSFVGPRPLLVEYLPLYNERQIRRHEIKPGITGWAQVNGRNTIDWETKFEYDVWYVEHLSFGLDLKILFLTIVNVFRSKDINSDTSATMEKFRGTKE